MTVGSLFAGIGGFDLGFERAGYDIRWQVEIDPWARAVLAKHWPHVHRHDDIRTAGAQNLETVDVLCGGFPCQDLNTDAARAALAHIDALAAEKDEAERAFRACARDRERLIAQLHDPAATYAMVQRGDLVLSDVFVANEARYRELGRIAEQAEARATAAEQRVAAMESHYAQLEQANAQTEARLREAEQRVAELEEYIKPANGEPEYVPGHIAQETRALKARLREVEAENVRLQRRLQWAASNWPLRLGRAGMHATQAEDRATLAEAAKAQAEQTAAALREALEQLLTVQNDAPLEKYRAEWEAACKNGWRLVNDAALHGQAAQEGE